MLRVAILFEIILGFLFVSKICLFGFMIWIYQMTWKQRENNEFLC